MSRTAKRIPALHRRFAEKFANGAAGPRIRADYGRDDENRPYVILRDFNLLIKPNGFEGKWYTIADTRHPGEVILDWLDLAQVLRLCENHLP